MLHVVSTIHVLPLFIALSSIYGYSLHPYSMQASTYELFFAGVVSESEKQAILDKYFDPDLCNSQLPPVSTRLSLSKSILRIKPS